MTCLFILFSVVFPLIRQQQYQMKKFFLITLVFAGMLCHISFGQTVKLTAIYDGNNSAVKLNWNMVNSNSRTSYLLLRSSDGITWTEAAKDRMLRYYTEDDIYFFNDRRFLTGKNYYRIKITDGNNNTISLSSIVVVNAGSTKTTVTYPAYTQSQTGKQSTVPTPKVYTPPSGNNSWIIYPNPVTDLLKLMYKGSEELKGVVNVQIQDVTGKTVIKFRSGSKYKAIEIPLTYLQRGSYFIQVSILNEIMMSQKFIKQ